MFLNRFHKPSFRVLATPYSEAREQSNEQVPMASLDGLFSLYFDGDLDAAFAFGGQVAGRIDEVKPVAQIIDETIAEFHDDAADARGPVRVVNDRCPRSTGCACSSCRRGSRARTRASCCATRAPTW